MWQRRACLLAGLALVAHAFPAFAADGKGPPPGVEPKADELLRRMSSCLAAAKQFSFEAEDMVDEMLDAGQKIQLSSTRQIVVHRPNKAAARVTGDMVNERVWANGGTLTILDLHKNTYGTIEVPENIDEMLDYVATRFGVAMPLADLLFSSPYEAVIDRVRAGQYIGLHEVRGIKCHHLAFRQDGLDWQIWIEDGDKPVPRKLVITHKATPGQPQYIAFFGNWDLAAQAADSVFAAELPEGAKPVDLPSALGGQTQPEDDRR